MTRAPFALVLIAALATGLGGDAYADKGDIQVTLGKARENCTFAFEGDMFSEEPKAMTKPYVVMGPTVMLEAPRSMSTVRQQTQGRKKRENLRGLRLAVERDGDAYILHFLVGAKAGKFGTAMAANSHAYIALQSGKVVKAKFHGMSQRQASTFLTQKNYFIWPFKVTDPDDVEAMANSAFKGVRFENMTSTFDVTFTDAKGEVLPNAMACLR